MTNPTRVVIAAIVLLFLLPMSGSAATDPQMAADAANFAREQAAAQLEALAEADGALGMYLDGTTNEYVVVLSASAQQKFRAADARGLDLSVRVETLDIDRDTIDRIDAALLAARPSIAPHSYSFAFNPETGLVDVASDAPQSAFTAIDRAFPGRLSYSWAKFESTTGNWTADSAPHWGGAYLQSSTATCTSGWTIKNAGSSTRYMVTAGHCFANGTSTNMGTVLRESAAYPAIDVELVRGKTYAGYIYADSATGERRVNDGNDPVIGSSYCITGRSSGFKCSWVAQQKGVKVCFSDRPGCTFDLIATKRSGSNTPFQPGDSGGPYFIKGGNLTVGVRGIMSGRSADIFGNWTSYVQGYKAISNYYVMQVVTS